MSVKKLERRWGITISCNGGPSARCPCKITTGQTTIREIRGYAKSIGWGRRRSDDLCAECFEQVKKARADKIARRDELRRMTPEQRREERNKQARERRAAKRAHGKEAA